MAAARSSANEIAERLGRTVGSVNARANRLSVPIRSPGSPLANKWSDEEIQVLRALAARGGTIYDGTRELMRDYESIGGKARALGLHLLPPDRSHHVQIAEDVTEVLDGLLLSDASLVLTGSRKSAALHMEQHPRRQEWLEVVQRVLATTGVVSAIRPSAHGPATFPGGRVVAGWRNYVYLRTRSYAELATERARWYVAVGAKKRVPHDVRITPRSVAHWFCGDGHGGDSSGVIGFCTNGFSEDDVEFLIERLMTNLGVYTTKYRQRQGQWHVKLSRKDAAFKLAEIVRPYLPDCFLYKLQSVRLPQARSARRALSAQRISAIRERFLCGAQISVLAHEFGVSWDVAERAAKGEYRD